MFVVDFDFIGRGSFVGKIRIGYGAHSRDLEGFGLIDLFSVICGVQDLILDFLALCFVSLLPFFVDLLLDDHGLRHDMGGYEFWILLVLLYFSFFIAFVRSCSMRISNSRTSSLALIRCVGSYS